MSKLTQEEYIRHNGTVCPLCGKYGSLDTGDLQPNDFQILQQVHCTKCGASFTDVYELKGFEQDE